MPGFGGLLSKYLTVYENQTETEGLLISELGESIGEATLSEIITEYNKLTVQSLWHDPLVSLFNDEFLSRANEATFMISTSWNSLSEYKPFVHVQIGYEDSYYVLNSLREPIRHLDSEGNSFSLLNDSFTDQEQIQIIRIILKGHVGVYVLPEENRVTLGTIFNWNDPVERVGKIEQGEPVYAQIFDSDDFAIIRKALNEMKNGFEVIDYWYDMPDLVEEPDNSEEDEE